MKKLAILFAIVTVFFTSCREEDDGVEHNFVDTNGITVGAEGGTEYLQVSSASEWVAVASEPWVSISPANGVGITKCSIVVDSTLINDVRSEKLPRW